MDLWNNAVGREHGLKAENRSSLLKMIHKALRDGKLVTNPNDSRLSKGTSHAPLHDLKPVVVFQESKHGRNELFFDTLKKAVLTLDEFVSLIEAGDYPGYSIKMLKGQPTPVSTPDSSGANNLG